MPHCRAKPEHARILHANAVAATAHRPPAACSQATHTSAAAAIIDRLWMCSERAGALNATVRATERAACMWGASGGTSASAVGHATSACSTHARGSGALPEALLFTCTGRAAARTTIREAMLYVALRERLELKRTAHERQCAGSVHILKAGPQPLTLASYFPSLHLLVTLNTAAIVWHNLRHTLSGQCALWPPSPGPSTAASLHAGRQKPMGWRCQRHCHWCGGAGWVRRRRPLSGGSDAARAAAAAAAV